MTANKPRGSIFYSPYNGQRDPYKKWSLSSICKMSGQSFLNRRWSHQIFVVCLCLVTCLPPCQADYGVCYDTMLDTYLSCMPPIDEIISTVDSNVAVSPSDATCVDNTYSLLGDRSDTVETCDANSEENRHPPEYMVDTLGTDTWWQSVNMREGDTELNVNITLSFDKKYRLAGDLIFTFQSGRPEKMVLWKSADNQQTWEPLQYYARNCDEFADQVVPGTAYTVEDPTAVICTNEYTETSSRATPGRTVEMNNNDRFNLFLGEKGTNFEEFYTALENQMLDFLIFTDLLIQLIEPLTDGRNDYSTYYYGISDIQAVARCYCNNHASECNYTDPAQIRCDCQHFTTGNDCEICLPLYNDRPWQRGNFLPYDTGTANICAKCECNDHADSCHYNETYGRGQCDDCQHNTEGYHCELCSSVFYPNLTLPLNDIERCLACDCEPLGVEANDLMCTQEETPTVPVGQCNCKAVVTGRRCDACNPGHWGLITGPTPGTCTACGCNLDGTTGQSNTCDQTTGQCPCKSSITGQLCDTCADGFYAFPTGSPERECIDCNCDLGGALSATCNKVTGVCTCREGIAGDKCDRTEDGRYVPALDANPLEPTAGTCQLTSDLYTSQEPFDGSQFAECDLGAGAVTVLLNSIPGGMLQLAVEWPYNLAVRYTTTAGNITGTLTVTPNGNTLVDLAPLSTRLGQEVAAGCPVSSSNVLQLPVTFTPDTSSAVSTEPNNITLDARCQYTISLQLTSETPVTVTRRKRAIGDGPFITIDSVLYLPTLSSEDGAISFTILTESDNEAEQRAQYSECLQNIASLSDRSLAMQTSPCDDLLFSVGAELYGGTLECQCDDIGTVPGSSSDTCEDLGGQCTCLTGVSGRQCDVCTPGYYNLTDSGCEPCRCSSLGATTGACDYTTGQCPCKDNIVLSTDEGTIAEGTPSSLGTGIIVDGTCSYCKPNFFGISEGEGCRECGCNAQGSTSLQCDETGQCPCKDSVQGLKCDVCKDGFFGFGDEGCTACNCSDAGSLSISCDQTTGVCDCKQNVEGDKCADCKSGFFNLAEYNPEGCQPCFCYGHGDTCTSADGFETTTLQTISPTSPEDYAPLLGDQHISYSQIMTIWMTAAYRLDLTGLPILTLTGGGGKIIQHRAGNDTEVLPTQTTMYSVRLLWQEWETIDENGTETQSTAQDVLEVLADLTEVAHVTRVSGQPITTSLISLTSATLASGSGGEPATFVEECTCDAVANVAGLSCEICATGFRRPSPTDISSYTTCVACDCSERGATDPPECDQITGVCLNCRNGTTGVNCELCAPHVIGDECDECEDQYWGLGINGCSPCACSDPGSLSPICDKVSGQCTCADHVIGRTCDECEENYYGLTATGCIECDSCYGVVMDEIAPLRELTADLAENVTYLQVNDVTSTLGPFNTRLQAATTDTESLVQFLETAQASESEILAQISGFNATLDSVETGLTTLEVNTTAVVSTALDTVSSLLFTADAYRQLMENAIKPAYSKIEESLKTSRDTLTTLVSSLQSVETQLETLAESNSDDQAILAQLEQLNATVSTAAVLAETVLQNAQAAYTVHQTTVIGLLSLEARLLSLSSVASTTLTNAQALDIRSGDMTSNRQRIQEALAQLQAFSVDYASINGRLLAAQAVTSSIQTQISDESGQFSATNVEVLVTVETVADLANQTLAIVDQSSHWLGRATAAEQTALRYQSEANTLLEAAQNTLNVVQNFEELSTDAQARAAESLEQVEQLTELSVQVINETESLTATLVTLGETASQAQEASQQALQIINQKQQDLSSVAVQSEELSIRLSTLSDGSIQREAIVDDVRDNIVTPAQQMCSNINSDIATFTTNLLETESNITNTLQLTSDITQRANALLVRLRSLPSVETASAVAQSVQDASGTLNFEDLRTTLVELQEKQAAQAAEITRLTDLRDGLQTRLDALRILRDQILN